MSTPRIHPSACIPLFCVLAISGIFPVLAQETAGESPAGDVLDTGIRILANGEVFEYTKLRQDGHETVLYTGQGLSLSAAELEQYEAAHPPPVIDEDLAQHARAAAADTLLDLTVWLRPRPGARLARQALQRQRDANRQQVEEIRGIHRAARSAVSLPQEEEQAFLARMVREGGLLTETQRQDLRSRKEQLDREEGVLRAEIRRQRAAAVAADQAAIAARVAELGGEVLGRIESQNAVTVRLSAARLPRLAEDPLVARILRLPPVEPELDNQAPSLGLTTGFWPDGIDGGLCDAGILDTGVRADHPAFADITVMSHIGAGDSDGHGTACAGIIASNDADYRGTAYGLDKLLVGSFRSHLVMSHADWMVSVTWDDPEAISLSGGYGTANGVDYSVFDQFWDALIDDNSALVATSAGNGGDAPLTLTHPATAYNLLAVTAMDDRNTLTRGDDRILPSSSRGPTPGDRKKPDMAAPGANTRTTCNEWATGPDFIDISGSSAAAAHVTAGAVLLTDMRGSDDPAANKAVLLNSADTWTDNGTASVLDDGPVARSEWNATYGWGYLNLREAWYNGPDVFVDTVGDGYSDFKLYSGRMFAGEKATLVWNRHVGYNGSSYPVAFEKLTDLDLVLYDELTGRPLSSSTSAIDNVEQVAVSAAGSVVLKVNVFGKIDPDVEHESFALATEEYFFSAGLPHLEWRPARLGPVSPNQSFQLAVQAPNPGGIAIHGNALEIELPAGFNLLDGANPRYLGSIASAASPEAVWTAAAPCGLGRYQAVGRRTSHSYGEELSQKSTFEIDVATIPLADDTAVLSRSVPRTYDFSFPATAWSVVALDPGASPHDLRTDDDFCLRSPHEASTLPGATRDFVVTNGHRTGVGTHYALVSSPSVAVGWSGLYTLEHEVAGDHLANAAAADHDFAPHEVVEVVESLLYADVTYNAVVDLVSGTTDVALFVYRADRMGGHRSNADFAVDAGGAGEGESLSFVTPDAGVYAFVMVNENAQGSSFRFELTTDLLFRDGFETGDTRMWSQSGP